MRCKYKCARVKYAVCSIRPIGMTQVDVQYANVRSIRVKCVDAMYVLVGEVGLIHDNMTHTHIYINIYLLLGLSGKPFKRW